MLRRVICWMGLFCLGWPVVHRAAGQVTTNEDAVNVGVQVANLKQQLKAGLRIQRPQDQAFIDRVAAMVETKELPLDLVKSTFMWARQKDSYPFVYFERGLRARANKRGISIVVPRR